MRSFQILRTWVLFASIAAMALGSPCADADPASQSLSEDVITPIARTAANRAAQITVANITLTRKFGATPAPEGRRFLVVGCEWGNVILLSHFAGAAIGTEYRVPDLADNLYLVADGKTLYRLWPKADIPGALKQKNFSVVPGSPLNGVLLFDLPANATFTRLELRFYDFAHGHWVLPLQISAQPLSESKPVAAPQSNEVLETAVYGLRTDGEIHGVGAPAGLTYVSLNLRARSTITTEANASAFDPHAAPDAKTVVGTVADWKESRKYLQMIVDGEYAWPAIDLTDLPKEPRFLPDVFTGGNVVFLVPEKHTSLELRCDFPNAKLTTGKIIRPTGLTMLLEGNRPTLLPRNAIAAVKDDIFDVAINEQSTIEQFAGIRATAGKRFLVLDVTVKNLGKQQEFFQTVEQLKHVDEKGAISPIDKAGYSGLRRPLEQIYIPSGEQRTFQLVYQIPVSEAKPRLAYASVTRGGSKMLDLPVIDALPGANPAVLATTQPASTQPGTTQPVKIPVVAQKPPADREPKAAPVTAKQNRKPHGLEGVGLKAEQVNLAIDRGSKALWELIRDEDLKGTGKFGSKPEHVLAALALVNAGAHKKIPECDATLRAYLKDVQPRKLPTYQAGLVAMLIEAYGDGEFGPKMEEAARHLLETQGPKGTWNYVNILPDALYKKTEVRVTTQPAVAGSTQDEVPILLVRRNLSPGTDADNSNLQYAILGLNTASRTGIKVTADVWQKALRTTLERQENSGGWGYHEKGRSVAYGSMTAAGICAVALCRHELGEAEPGKDEAIESGLGWLAANFSVTEHPKSYEWVYYYIYALERVGRILDTEFIGPYEWYPLGAEHLVGQQKPGGLWIGKGYEGDPRLSSSFALLFLTRATPALNLKQKLRPPAPPPVIVVAPPVTKPVVAVVTPAPPPPVIPVVKPKPPGTLRTVAVAPFHNFYIILDASGSMLDEMDGKVKFDIARDAVRSLVNDLPAGCNVALRVYGHRKRAIENQADEDTELMIRMAPLDKQKFVAVLDSLRARGKTPMALSLEEAVKDLGVVDPQKPVTLLLLTDGGEDTQPRRDPLKSADLVGRVKGIRFHVVGFDINQPDWAEQLQGMAQHGGGRYWPAARAADLELGIHNSVLGVPGQYVVLDIAGREVARAAFGQPAILPEGKYRLQTIYAGKPVEREFSISAASITAVTFDAAEFPLATGDSTIPAATRPSPRPAERVTEIVKRFCTSCGAPLATGVKFCEKCGAKVNP